MKSDTAPKTVVDLGAASVQTKGVIQGTGESVGKQRPLGLSND